VKFSLGAGWMGRALGPYSGRWYGVFDRRWAGSSGVRCGGGHAADAMGSRETEEFTRLHGVVMHNGAGLC